MSDSLLFFSVVEHLAEHHAGASPIIAQSGARCRCMTRSRVDVLCVGLICVDPCLRTATYGMTLPLYACQISINKLGAVKRSNGVLSISIRSPDESQHQSLLIAMIDIRAGPVGTEHANPASPSGSSTLSSPPSSSSANDDPGFVDVQTDTSLKLGPLPLELVQRVIDHVDHDEQQQVQARVQQRLERHVIERAGRDGEAEEAKAGGQGTAGQGVKEGEEGKKEQEDENKTGRASGDGDIGHNTDGRSTFTALQRLNRAWYLEITPRWYRHFVCTHDLGALIDEPEEGSLALQVGSASTAEEACEEEHPIDWSAARRVRWALGFVERLTFRPEGERDKLYGQPGPLRDCPLFPRLRYLAVDLPACAQKQNSFEMTFGQRCHIGEFMDSIGGYGRTLRHVCLSVAVGNAGWGIHDEDVVEAGRIAPFITIHGYSSPFRDEPLFFFRIARSTENEVDVNVGLQQMIEQDGPHADSHAITVAGLYSTRDSAHRLDLIKATEFAHDMRYTGDWKLRHGVIPRSLGTVDGSLLDAAMKSDTQKEFERRMRGVIAPELVEYKHKFTFSYSASDVETCPACGGILPMGRWVRLSGRPEKSEWIRIGRRRVGATFRQ